ncbi:MAG: putative manganese-dependent inorganic diphosphatase [Coriobacteriaceae bacterium]|jgi:manganese-dependent inorganic pyrophosphatase|nr:putative manganese-dependent inorganic diphosphatase [Coriobacteriaceae bacterium]
MAAPIVVLGHKNPDNDSICSAVAYASLKNQLERRAAENDPAHEAVVYVPVRLGPLPPESAWVLEANGIPAPRMLSHLHARVADVMTPDPITISQDATLLEAGRLLRKHNIRALVVTDAKGAYCGLITTRMLAERYIASTDALADDNSNEKAVALDLIASLNQKVRDTLEKGVLVLDKEGLLKEAVEDLMSHPLREAVVLDDNERCIGIVTRSDVATRPARKAVLVDHNETRQSAPGIEEADVIEVIDHHRIGDVATSHPIPFINLPVGSTATIVAREFQRQGIALQPSLAAVLLSAILTDTVILKSPTTTPADEEQVAYLAGTAGLDPVQFGLELFRQRTGSGEVSIERLVGADAKEFQLGDAVALIAQHETVDLPSILEREDEIRACLRALKEEKGYEFVLLMVTDIMAEGSQFFCEGNRRIVNRVFNIECTGAGGTWMPGILSRKKQVASRILGA